MVSCKNLCLKILLGFVLLGGIILHLGREGAMCNDECAWETIPAFFFLLFFALCRAVAAHLTVHLGRLISNSSGRSVI